MTKLTDNASLTELQRYVERAASDRGFADETLAQKFMLLAEEVGEFAKAARKDAGIKTDGSDSRNVEHEAADLLFVFLNLCNKLDIDLEKAFTQKEVINNSRTWK